MSRDANVGVHTEARNAGTTWTGSDGKIFQIDPVPNLRYPVASPRAGGNASGDRSAVEFGEQRLVVMERVGFVPIGLRPQTAAFKKPRDKSGKPLFRDFTGQKPFVFNVGIRKKRPFRISL
jgi:hypothetical protein